MTTPPPVPKLAVSISGGGAHGQYAVGSLKAIIKELGRKPDIYCGVSIGGIIAAHMAQYLPGKEEEAYDDLERLMTPIVTSDIWKYWWCKPFHWIPMLWKPSLYDNGPSEELVKEHLSATSIRESGKKLRVGAVSLDSGEYRVFTEESVPLIDAVLASASFPVFFKPVKMVGERWSDGGIRTVSPIMAAIEAGATEIIAITLSPVDVKEGFEPSPSILDVGMRALRLQLDETVANDIKIAQLYTELVEAGKRPDKRAVKITHIQPAKKLKGGSLDFDPDRAEEAQLQGYRDTIEALSAS